MNEPRHPKLFMSDDCKREYHRLYDEYSEVTRRVINSLVDLLNKYDNGYKEPLRTT